MNLQENISLSKYTSLHVGGEARYFVAAPTTETLREALEFATQKNIPFFILGKGSNTIFPDEGYPGLVILIQNRTLTHEGSTIIAGAGVFMRQLVTFAHKQGLVGLENLAGIPGTVGGAVRGNAGTWETETKDVVRTVRVLKPKNDQWQEEDMTNEACGFAYRTSIFKAHPDWVILSATFSLAPGDTAAGQKEVMEDLRKRHDRQPYDAPSAGSVFKNPDKANDVFAGDLIERAGLKGTRRGGAMISPKHANFIVNLGTAKSADVLALVRLAQETVQEKFGVRLEPEIQIVEVSS